MGKASRFFKSLLGFKTTDSPPSQSDSNNNKKKLKRRWSFVKSRQVNSERPSRHRNASKSLDGTSLIHHHRHRHHNVDENEDSNKHAIALAAATAAVVNAAVATAQAAAEVVRMTSRTAGYDVHEQMAAIKIQSYFRAYLARKARRALKALVRLQAVVRGHILRKQTADMMRRLQALIRAQARARALRSQITDHSTTKPSSHCHFHPHGPPTPEKLEHLPHTRHHHSSISKRNNSKSYARGQERTFHDGSTDNEHDKIVEVDTVEPHVMFNYGRKFLQPDQISFGYSQSLTTSRGSTFQPTNSSPCASYEVNSFDESVKGGVSTPIKSDGSRSCFSGYSDHPNYMANTESSRAKVRSLSAPRLRPHLESLSEAKRESGCKYMPGVQHVPATRESFAKKAYPGSGRLDRLGMPVYDWVESEFYDSYWN